MGEKAKFLEINMKNLANTTIPTPYSKVFQDSIVSS
jgi:hypothetical protein